MAEVKPGQMVVIKPAYDQTSKHRSRVDDVAGRLGIVVKVEPTDVRVRVDQVGKVWLHPNRLEVFI